MYIPIGVSDSSRSAMSQALLSMDPSHPTRRSESQHQSRIPLPRPEEGTRQTDHGYTSERPPPLAHSKSLHSTIPLPPQVAAATEVALHSVLIHWVQPKIYVDFSLSPTADILPPLCLVEPATCPKLPSLTVVHPDLPWAITVHASTIDPSCVTIADVLRTLRRFLGLPVTEQDYYAWVTDPANSQRNRGYKDRPHREHIVAGMTRLNFLAGKTRFVGLVPSTMGSSIWVLEVVYGSTRSRR